MFAIQRSEKILEILNEKGIVYVNDLVELFHVSDVTIRKDLNKLQEQGLITKTHGGAVLNKNQLLNPQTDTSEPNTASSQKEKIAAAAYSYIRKGDTFFLGSGYTCTCLAKYITREDDISVITNNLEAALILKEKCKTLILLGGEVVVYDNYTFTTNAQISDYLNLFNINKAITSCSAIDHIFGVSVSTEVSHRIITNVLKAAHSWYLLVDHFKFNNVSPYKVADISSVDCILTDQLLDEYKKFDNIVDIK